MTTQTTFEAVRPTETMTPRTQMTRVFVGVTLAVMVGAGPAVAWDMTTQMPHRAAASAWSHPKSPWRRAGHDLKDAFKTLTRVYLPRTGHVPAANQPPAPPAPTASSIASAVPPIKTAKPVPTVELEVIE